MKKSLNLLANRLYRPSWVYYRYLSRRKYEGIQHKFDEDQARLYFDQWIKSLWFAPGEWTQSTRDDAITVTRLYLPFWSFSLQGSISAFLQLAYETRTKRANGKHLVLTRWHDAPIILNSVFLNSINVYAAQTLDRYHLNNLNISFDNDRIIQLDSTVKELEQWTVDQDTAFQIGWDLNVIPQIKRLCIQQAKQAYPQYDNYRVKSFHFVINNKKQRLLYYPIYVINYKYDSQSDFTCLVDGITGQVTGDRQYSMVKVTFATLIGFYPMALAVLATVGPAIDPSIADVLVSLFTFKNSIPIALIVAPLVGLLAKNYPRFYRQRINQQQWQNYQSNASHFTYDFRTSFEQQYQSFRQEQQRYEYQRQQEQQRYEYQRQQEQYKYRQQYGQRQRTKESTSTRREEESSMDLYELLSVSRTATEREIKRAYLLKAKELHPDRNPGDKKVEELFKKVNQAYTILSDKYKREQYDKYGYESVKYN